MAKFTSTTGNDTFIGALGNDIAVFNGTLQGYIIDYTNDILTIADTLTGDGGIEDGMDSISGIEKLIFTGNNKQLLLSQEAVVNINTTGQQTETAMLATSDGGFYSFWQSSANIVADDGEELEDDGEGYYFRKFDENGVGVGVDIRLLTGVGGGVRQAVFADDTFVLVWTGPDSSGSGVFIQKFDATGKALFDKFRVNDTITDNQTNPDVAVLEDGSFVVTWTSSNQGDALVDGIAMGDTPNQSGIFSQLFDQEANPLGWETKVSPSGGGEARVTATNDGGYVITYEAIEDGEPDKMKVFAIKYDDNGEAEVFLGNDYVNQVIEVANNELSDSTKKPVIATLANGNVVVAWQSPDDAYPANNIDYDRSIKYRIYNQSGASLSNELKANTLDSVNSEGPVDVYEQSKPAIAALSGGGFVITWQSMQSDNSYWGVYAQVFDSAGAKVGSEFLVNTKTADSQEAPSVVGLTDGGFVISWEGEYQDGMQQGLFQEGTAGSEIVMQRYDAAGNKLGASFAGTAAADTLTISGQDAIELDGAAGNDTLTSAAGDDTLRGGIGDDSMVGNEGNDILIGGDGKDTITGGTGNDTIVGGADSDRYVLSGNYADYTVIGGNGTYTITDLRGAVFDDGNLVTPGLDGQDLIAGIELLSFADQDVSIDSGSSGGVAGEMLVGDIAVADVLDGGDNNDTLQGGGNNKGVALDTLQGGDGDDTYIVAGNAAVIFDTDGSDTLQIALSIDLTKQSIGKLDGLQYIENVVLQGAKALKIVGSSDDNDLTGNNGANNIKGGAGDDTLNGGFGKDVLTGGDGSDIFIFDSAPSKSNVDRVADFEVGSDNIYLSEAFYADLDPDENGVITYVEGKGLKASANDEVSFIVYDTRGGGLYYDAAGEKAVLIATFAKVAGLLPDLDASDFSLI